MSDKIIEKIKKLLRTKGRTAPEIETALSLAKKLADKNNIDLNKINPDEERKPITHCDGKELSRLQIENRYSALIVNRFFSVNTFINYSYSCGSIVRSVVFVGTQSDIEIAKYIFNFLINHFRREWRTNRGRLRNRQAFMNGLYHGLWYKLIQSEKELQQQEGIILSNGQSERNDYIQKYFGKTSDYKVKPDKDSDAARWQGWQSGVNTNIRKGLNTTPESRQLNS